MDVNDRLLRRLERIEELDHAAAPAAQLIAELQLLVGEAEEWAGVEGDRRARDAVARLRGKAGGMG